jgi:hypothetical protein
VREEDGEDGENGEHDGLEEHKEGGPGADHFFPQEPLELVIERSPAAAPFLSSAQGSGGAPASDPAKVGPPTISKRESDRVQKLILRVPCATKDGGDEWKMMATEENDVQALSALLVDDPAKTKGKAPGIGPCVMESLEVTARCVSAASSKYKTLPLVLEKFREQFPAAALMALFNLAFPDPKAAAGSRGQGQPTSRFQQSVCAAYTALYVSPKDGPKEAGKDCITMENALGCVHDRGCSEYLLAVGCGLWAARRPLVSSACAC